MTNKDDLFIYEGSEPSLSLCRKILCKDGDIYSDEEIIMIRELFMEWADVFANNLVREVEKLSEQGSDDGNSRSIS